MNTEARTRRPPHRAAPSRAAPWTRGLLTTGAALLSLAFSVGSVEAQGVVTGEVTASDTGDPISGANVRIQGTDLGAVSTAGGEFTIRGIPSGSQVVQVEVLGYRSAVETVDVDSGETVEVDFDLATRPVELTGIQVSVLRPDLQPQAELTEREVRRANPQDAGQVLRNLPGVDAARRGPLGLDPVVRGLRETEVGTYLDGTRIFPAGPARMDSPLTHLDPSAIRSIEVVKGPYALTWGAGNLSAIRVETAPLPRRGERVPRGNLSTGYDTNLGAAEVSGNVAGRTGGVSYWVHGAWREGNDYEPGNDGPEIPGEFTSSEIRGEIGFDVGENSLLSVTGGYQDQGPLEYPGRLLRATRFYASNLALEWVTERQEGTLRRFEVSAYRNDVSHGMDNTGKPTRLPVSESMRPPPPPFGIDVVVDSDMEVVGGRAAADLMTSGWNLRIGGDVYSANRNARRTISRLTEEPVGMGPPVGTVLFDDTLWPDATITDAGLYTRAARTLDSGVRLSGTLRLDQVWAEAADPSDRFLQYLEDTGRSQDLERTETNLSAALTAGFDLNTNWNVSLGLGSAVRTASPGERYSDHLQSTKAQTAAEFMGTPDLEPERSNQADIWLGANYPGAAFQLNLFGRQVTDYITLAITEEAPSLPLPIFPSDVYRYINGEATFFGGETSFTYGLTDVLTAEVGGSYLWGEETLFPTDADVEVEEPAFGVAPPKGRLGLRYEEVDGRYFLEGTATLVAEQDRVATSRGESPTEGYQVFDIRAGVALLRGVNLRFGVENVFDEGYVNHLNSRNPYMGTPIPEPGRVFFVDLSYSF